MSILSLVLWFNIVLDIEVLLNCPVNKLRKQNLSTAILVDLCKFSVQIFDRPDPLK